MDLPAFGNPTSPTSASSFSSSRRLRSSPGLAVFVLGRRLVGGGGEARIAPAAASALGDDEPLARLGEIVTAVRRCRRRRPSCRPAPGFDRRAVPPGPVAAFAVTAALGLVLGIEAEMEQRVVVLAGNHDDVAAAAAVAAAGPAPRDELLAAERQAAVSAVAGFYFDSDFVDEHVHRTARCYKTAEGSLTVQAASLVISEPDVGLFGGLMLTNLPMRPRSRNSTMPVTFANNVSSLPKPTFSPGLICVPRWRTMIDPPVTNCAAEPLHAQPLSI